MSGSSSSSASPNSLQQKLYDIERKLYQFGLIPKSVGNKKPPNVVGIQLQPVVVPPTVASPFSDRPLLAIKPGCLTSPLPRRPMPLIPPHGQGEKRPARPTWTDLERSSPNSSSTHRRSGHRNSADHSGENERRLQEIMKLTGILRIDGKEYKCKTDDMHQLGDLGQGSCGHVVKMRHNETGFVLAVKQMRRSGNKEENKRIVMDLDVVLRSHDCEYIVKCLGCFITDSDVWICMELMSTSLDKVIKRIKCGIPEPILGRMAVLIVKALSYLKDKQGIIHRDVKPSNMLLDSDGTIKLCDFGISGRLVESKAKTRTAGCAAYMAPERIDPPDPKNAEYDVRADVWSLGISLVELAEGHFPYVGCQNDFEVLTRILQEEPPSLRQDGGFSAEFFSFVSQCLKKDYKQRPKYKTDPATGITGLLDHPFIKRYEVQEVDVASWFQHVMESSPADPNCNM